jgi:uncharacterized protein
MNSPPSQPEITLAIRAVLPQARAAWIFGSAARQAMRDDSDLDIAVSLPHPLPARELVRAVQALSVELNIEVDLLDFTHAHTVMQFQILNTGLLLFSDDPVALEQYRGFVLTEYQHMQAWRQPMMAHLARRLSKTGAPA